MDVCVMTFFWSEDNYGQLLQAWSMRTYLESLGHSVRLIDYGYLHNPWMKLGETLVKLVNGGARYERAYPKHFDRFRSERLAFTPTRYRSVNHLKKHPPQADAYLCGSDQVWHYRSFAFTWLIKRYADAVMLNFGSNDCLRIAYAPSFGVTKIQENDLSWLKPKLDRFTCLSTRERSSVEMLESASQKPVEWVPDPTLLCPLSCLEAIADTHTIAPKEYFVYALGNVSVMKGRDIIDVLRTAGKSFNYTSSQFENDYEANCAPTIEQWLGLVKSSGAVITNSFHGVVYSVLFHRPFWYYPLLAEVNGHDERILSLLARLGIGKRSISSKQELLAVLSHGQSEIDWKAVDAQVASFRAVGQRYLEDALMHTTPAKERLR